MREDLRHVCLEALACNTPKGQEAVLMRDRAEKLLARYRKVGTEAWLAFASTCKALLVYGVGWLFLCVVQESFFLDHQYSSCLPMAAGQIQTAVHQVKCLCQLSKKLHGRAICPCSQTLHSI